MKKKVSQITVFTPEAGHGFWQISVNGGVKKTTLSLILNYAKKKLVQMCSVNKKTVVIVKYSKDTSDKNWSLKSSDYKYLFYCLVCFLEDYLTTDSFRQYQKEYSKYSTPNDI